MNSFFIIFHVLILIFVKNVPCETRGLQQEDLIQIVKLWANNLGDDLAHLAENATRIARVKQSFSHAEVIQEDGTKILEDIADKLKVMMAQKEVAVRRIVDKAELLALNRKDDIRYDSSYDYYNSDNLTNTTYDEMLEEELRKDLLKREAHWRCNEQEVPSKRSIFHEENDRNDEICENIPYVEYPRDYFRYLPLEYHQQFGEPINLNYSIGRVATSVYDRDKTALNDARWSEALDLVFKQNFEEDPTLHWQFFGGATGFMRYYPATVWSQERYDKTYDFRTRAWYLESVTSTKDVIILLDRSGSMANRNWFIGKQIVNMILDTLGDNDHVNVYIFNNQTDPLVDCFNFTLMQAHEENLRLLRENLDRHHPGRTANLNLAFKKAFEVLNTSNHCNQAIMLISDSIDYDYHPTELFKAYNESDDYYRRVRVFTYLIGTKPSDAIQMEWMACANMGYYVNITGLQEVNEKVLKYLKVMSRPLNLHRPSRDQHLPVWTGAYVDLADRRLSNWLWKKFEGTMQRQIWIDYTRDAYKQYGCFYEKPILETESHFLLKTSHEYEVYKLDPHYNYTTTVSLPVYDTRPNQTDVLGVAGVDVPLDYIKKLLMPYRTGVNGYSFVLTNNGLLLIHPDHRREFQNILKPTFNRVDVTEVELLDDTTEPRDFSDSILRMREKIIRGMQGSAAFNVKTHLEDMKRLILSRRHYYYTKIGPFSLVVTLPDRYGTYKIKYDGETENQKRLNLKLLVGLRNTKNWKIHPEWLYCKYYGKERRFFQNPEDELRHFFNVLEKQGGKWPKFCDAKLVTSLLMDAKVTEWFEDTTYFYNLKDYFKKYGVKMSFLATHSGLTRWMNADFDFWDQESKSGINSSAINEPWYMRSVEYNYHSYPESYFVYSVPFKSDQNSTVVTASTAIFRANGSKKSPVASIGFQFSRNKFAKMVSKATSYCGKNRPCPLTCSSEELNCFVLDNNAYIVDSDNSENIGEFLGKVRSDIMETLVEYGVYRRTRFFDYQGICQLDDPKKPSRSSRFPTLSIFQNLFGAIKWIFYTILYLIDVTFGAISKDTPCTKANTTEYTIRRVRKTVPTPCDKEMWLYTLSRSSYTNTNTNTFTISDCVWPFIVQQIPGTNLILLVINALCKPDSSIFNQFSPDPQELRYNLSMPCYIATNNNFYRTTYIRCYNRHVAENYLNLNKTYCGSEGEIEL